MLKNMKIRSKLLIMILFILTFITALYFVVTFFVIGSLEKSLEKGTNELVGDIITEEAEEDAIKITELSESIRNYISKRWEDDAFDKEALKNIQTKDDKEKLENALPIINSINIVKDKAEEMDIEFSVVRKNARNKTNEAVGKDIEIFNKFETENIKEFSEIDNENNKLNYYRRIEFTKDCIYCHGTYDDISAYWQKYDGTDPFGFKPENRKAGEFYALYKIGLNLSKTQQISTEINEIFRKKSNEEGQKGIIFNTLVSLPIFALAIILVILLVRKIVKKIDKIKNSINKIAEKDYTEKISVTSKDEIGKISEGINILHNTLNETLKKIKDVSSNINLTTKSLSESINTSSNKIGLQISSFDKINEKANEQFNIVEIVNTSLQKLMILTNKIVENIHNQSSNVRETSAAVTEMISSVSSIANVTENANKTAQELSSIMSNSRKDFTDLMKAISEIRQFSDQVQEIITIISSIATKTNLLAINSSIEAAHSGHSGKGFGVVAEEIRKLAENTAENVANIEEILQNITEKIENASFIQTKSIDSFKLMGKLIKETAEQNSIISQAMAEQGIGNKEILQATTTLLEITQNIVDITGEEQQNLLEISNVSGQLKEISDKVVSEIGIQKTHNEDVTKSLEKMLQNIKITEKQVENLETLIGEFKLKKESSEESSIKLVE